MKKPAASKKETFYVKRTVVTETTIEVDASDEAEALRLIMRGQGEEIYSTTHAHLSVED